MRTLSVGQIKGANKIRHKIPREGSQLRKLYDKLVDNRGKAVDVTDFYLNSRDRGAFGTSINQLVDFYGLDIRSAGKGRYILVGEWFGRVYVDYLVEETGS